jgi:hypothetical protein
LARVKRGASRKKSSKRLKRVEDRIDNEAAKAALKESGKSIPWEKIKSELGL